MPHSRSHSDATAELGVTGSNSVRVASATSQESKRPSTTGSRLNCCIEASNSGNTGLAQKSRSVPAGEADVFDPADDAVSLETETPRTDHVMAVHRLVLLSDKTPKSYRIAECCLPEVVLIHYKNDSSVLNDLLQDARFKCHGKVIQSVAFMCHSQDAMIHLCSSVEKHFTQNPITIPEIKNFFLGIKDLMTQDEDTSEDSPCSNRVDFLGMRLTPGLSVFIEDLARFLQVKVGLSQDTGGCDIRLEKEATTPGANSVSPAYVGQFYFDVEKLRALTMSVPQSMAGFEKIRLVGKGAYGAAVLYRKKDDDTLVILKEINMIDLTASERQLALNEVKILSMLDHPNIISYYDHFEEDGVLIIEMEYADGGTLAQMLSQRSVDDPMEEAEILVLFQQMVAALRHIHSHHILHRDFKTDNIFLTKEGIVKLGDFGISKMMTSTRRLASTVLGTPYYISPELCEGKEYNEKSDIWALGCVLYEMACGQRTFDGSNLPALVTKIMKGQFAPIKSTFSQSFRVLIRDMLQRDPQYRPSSHELLYMRLPELMKNVAVTSDKRKSSFFSSSSGAKSDLEGSTDGANRGGGGDRSSDSANARSLVYEFNLQTMRIDPISFPFRVKIKQFSASSTHVVCVSAEMSVFTWGEGSKGQLGHESLESCAVPTEVESLRGKSIVRVGAGEGFTVFGCDNGILLTSGDGTRGCLGHGDWNNSSKARLIESLLSVDIVSFACGPMHVAAVSSEGVMYAWGVGADGRLGLAHSQDRNTPSHLTSPDAEGFHIRRVFCGVDGTMFLADVGCLLACGSNSCNKLGLNNRQGFLMGMKNFISKIEVEGSNVPVVVKCLAKHRVVSVSMGRSHTGVIVDQGSVYLLGNNSDGQLGIGTVKQKHSPVMVKELEHEKAVSLACSNSFTLVLTSDSCIHLMGTLPKLTAGNASAPTSPFATCVDNAASSFDNTNPLHMTHVTNALPVSANEKSDSNSSPGDSLTVGATSVHVNSILKPPRSPSGRSIGKDSGDSREGSAGLTQNSELGAFERGDNFEEGEFSVSSIDTTYICSPHLAEEVQLQVNVGDRDSLLLDKACPSKIHIPRLSFSCMGADTVSVLNETNDCLLTSEDFDQFSACCSRKKCSTALSSVVDYQVPLSNVPDEIGLAFHVMEPLTPQTLSSTVITKFVADKYPHTRVNSEPSGGVSSMKRNGSSDYPNKDSVTVAALSRHKTHIRELVQFGSQSATVLIAVDTDAPMPKRKIKRRRIRRPKESSPSTNGEGGALGEASGFIHEGAREGGVRGHHKRYSSATSSQDGGDYTTEPDSETSGPDTNLQDTSTSSTVPTWLRKELDEDFLPIPCSTGPDSCYSSDEETLRHPNRHASSNNDNNRTPRNAKESASHKRPLTAAPDLRSALNTADKNGGHTAAVYMSTSNSSADLMMPSDNPQTTPEHLTKPSRSGNRPATGKSGSRASNGAGDAKVGSSKRNASNFPNPAACYGAPIPRPPGSSKGKTSSSKGAAGQSGYPGAKPTAVVGPESRKAEQTSVKSTNERNLEQQLEQMKREKEEMQRIIQQMRQQLNQPTDMTNAHNLSAYNLTSDPAVMEGALHEELALMRSELRNQAQTLADNAAELHRMQQQLQHHSQSPSSHANSSLSLNSNSKKSSAESLTAMDKKSSSGGRRGVDDNASARSRQSQSSSQSHSSGSNRSSKSKSSKVCSLS